MVNAFQIGKVIQAVLAITLFLMSTSETLKISEDKMRSITDKYLTNSSQESTFEYIWSMNEL